MDAEGTFTVCRLNLGHGCISQHKVAQAPGDYFRAAAATLAAALAVSADLAEAAASSASRKGLWVMLDIWVPFPCWYLYGIPGGCRCQFGGV